MQMDSSFPYQVKMKNLNWQHYNLIARIFWRISEDIVSGRGLSSDLKLLNSKWPECEVESEEGFVSNTFPAFAIPGKFKKKYQ